MYTRKILWVITVMVFVAMVFVTCVDQPSQEDPRGVAFAGSATCMNCHKNLAEHYFHSNHYKTSSIPIHDSITKWLNHANREVKFTNGDWVALETSDYTTRQVHKNQDGPVQSASMDIAFGSGEKAVTFGYWKDEQLLQLPLTYLRRQNVWTNSPGFPIDQPYFTRTIIARCFECHSSYAQHYAVNEQPMQLVEKIKPNSIVMGIDCERCHGAAAAHVQYHTQHPEEQAPQHMTSVKTLSRQQQLDMCATCHSGNPVSLQSIFNFKPGDSLAKYYMYYPFNIQEPDVHGMQLQLLQKSKCYQQSTLTCITCHTTHDKNDNRQIVFMASCVSCHEASAHSQQMKAEKKYCVSCHMPMRASRSLDFNNSIEAGSIPYKLRTHRIAIYPETEWDQQVMPVN